MQEKIKSLEAELRLRGDEHAKQTAACEASYEEDMRRLQATHAQILDALLEKNSVQAKDILALQAIVVTLRQEISTQKMELEEA